MTDIRNVYSVYAKAITAIFYAGISSGHAFWDLFF